MRRRVDEVAICGQQDQVVLHTQASNQCIDCSNLYTASATGVTKGCGLDVVVAIADERCQVSKALDNALVSAKTREALQNSCRIRPRVTTAAPTSRAWRRFGTSGCC